MNNAQEPPQGDLLTDCLEPVLIELHPNGRYFIGRDCGIYWRITDTLLKGAKSPDWYYVPDVPATLKGLFRRSYVLWQEIVPPLVVIEFVSGDGQEGHDQTPNEGKFWVYENRIGPAYYAIFDPVRGTLEVYRKVIGRFERMTANSEGRYSIGRLNVELGIWEGRYENSDVVPWLRWWKADGTLLPHKGERTEQQRQQAETARQQVEQARLITELARQEVVVLRQQADAERRRAEVAEEQYRELLARFRA